jgi:hypothetical protein
MWIMIIRVIPTDPSPPKFGIFWSVPWPPEGGELCAAMKRQDKRVEAEQRLRRCEATLLDDADVEAILYDSLSDCRAGEILWVTTPLGQEPYLAGARRIRYQDRDIRVFPHEFSPLDSAKMREFMPAYELVPDNVAEDSMIAGVLDGETRPIYEAALMDGCSHHQAMSTALGMDITVSDAEYPAIGWYRLLPEYAAFLPA